MKANQPTPRAEMESAFEATHPSAVDSFLDHDKGHGRIGQRTVGVVGHADWLDGARRFPGELHLPHAATLIRAQLRAELADRSRFETRHYISSATLSAVGVAEAMRGHCGIGNRLHWVMDAVFNDDPSRLRKGHGAKNTAIVRQFALNLVRTAKDKNSVKLREKAAGWDAHYLAELLGAIAR